MERNRSKKAKSLRAAGSKSVNIETHMVPSPRSPPDINFSKRKICVRRWFQNAVVANQAFTLADGHSQFLTVTSVAGAAVPYADCWRIKSISIWAVAEGNFSTQVTISPTGTDLTSNMNNDPEGIYTLNARSSTEPAHMKIVSSKFRPLGSWHFTSATNFAGTLFQVNIGVGGGTSHNRCTLDIEFEYIDNLVGLPLGYSVSTATTTVGTIGGRNILSGFSLTGINNLG